MGLKVIQLTKEQCIELEDMQAEIMQIFAVNPERLGVIMAQVIPPQGIMRVRVFDHTTYLKLQKVLPPVEE